MNKRKLSGPQLFIYIVIGMSLIISFVCFLSYYLFSIKKSSVLWTGIVFFMIMYHLWLRILLGNISNHMKLDHRNWLFKERKFEKKLYSLLKVKNWKGKALTYNPEIYSVKSRSLEEIVWATLKSEADHWINQLISLSSIFFSLIWGKGWIFTVTAFLAMLFDGQFILIQRFNRPRILNLINIKEKRKDKSYEKNTYCS